MFVSTALRCLMKLAILCEWEWKRVAAIRLLRKERLPALSFSKPVFIPLSLASSLFLSYLSICESEELSSPRNIEGKALCPPDNRCQSLNTQFFYIMCACAHISWSQTGFSSFYKNIAKEYEENPQVCCMFNSMYACTCSMEEGNLKGRVRGHGALPISNVYSVKQHTHHTRVCVCVCVRACACRCV
jgi:hypothetical protein